MKKGFSDFLGFFLETKFRQKKCVVFWKIFEKLFFSGKKSNFKFQNGGYFGEKNLNPHGQQALFSMKKGFSDFLGFFLEIKFRYKKCAVFWEIFEKLFLSGKKSNSKFQKSWNSGSNSLWVIDAFLKPRAKRSAPIRREAAQRSSFI